MEQALSGEALEALKQAKIAQQKLREVGVFASDESESIPQSNEQQPIINTGHLEEEKIYENFVELVNLPSWGKFYSETLKAQPMKIPDILLIQGITEENMTSRFTEIFGRRVRGVKPLDIVLVDEFYLSLWIRQQTFPDYLFPHEGYTCRKCAFNVPPDMAEFNFNNIEVKTNMEEMIKVFGEKGYVEKELPVSKLMVKIYPKRRKHLARMEKILDDNYYKDKKTPPEGVEELLHLVCSVELGKITDLRKVFEYIQSENFDPNDLLELIRICMEYVITEEILVNLTCPNPDCKEVTPVSGYPFRKEIYFPLYSSRKPKTGKN